MKAQKAKAKARDLISGPATSLAEPEPLQTDTRPLNPSAKSTIWAKYVGSLAASVSGASLAIFRIAVGLVMILEAWSLVRPSASTNGRVMLDTYYTGTDIHFHFPYAWFEWVPVLSNQWMHALVAILAGASLLVAVGLFYRIAAVILFLAWGYFYVIESTRTYWMSYYYLELLVTFLLIWMPAARRYSVDAWLRRKILKNQQPLTIPNACLLLLRLQLLIAYFYAGVAKLNSDWLLNAVPMKNFLATAASRHFQGILWVQDLLHSVSFAYFLSWSGALFDVSIGFLLLARKTRFAGFVLLLLFHAFNHFVLFDDIIWFPLLGVTTATIFFEPDWPEKIWRRLKRTKLKTLGGENRELQLVSQFRNPIAVLILFWLGVQILLPIRHYFIAGDGRFTWEGLPFSWRLKTEMYSADPCEIFLHDPAIVQATADNKFAINLSAWDGDPCIYRKVTPAKIDWKKMPELVAIFEPEIGERIIYNPFTGRAQPPSEAESIQRVKELWRELYQREPKSIRPTIPMAEVVDGYIEALRRRGVAAENRQAVIHQIFSVHGRSGSGQMIPFLRRVEPFATQFKALSNQGAFVVIEDDALMQNSGLRVPRIKRTEWKSSQYSREQNRRYHFSSGEPLVIYEALDFFEQNLFPQTRLVDRLDRPEEPLSIAWNYLADATVSQGMHMSMQPFLLQRYAVRIAELWKGRYGRFPQVTAQTSVSLNNRHAQRLVDPVSDLASVEVNHFSHNPWIKDLE
jgi:uncharacterized membrane protein YphA (DoxX/SURF4 family)